MDELTSVDTLKAMIGEILGLEDSPDGKPFSLLTREWDTTAPDGYRVVECSDWCAEINDLASTVRLLLAEARAEVLDEVTRLRSELRTATNAAVGWSLYASTLAAVAVKAGVAPADLPLPPGSEPATTKSETPGA